MNEQLQNAMAGLIEKLNTVGDFAMDQVPDVLQQFILWERVSVVLWLVFAALCGFFGVYRNVHVLRTLDWHGDGELILRVIILACALVFSITCLGSGLIDLSAFIAPKYHIVKQFM